MPLNANDLQIIQAALTRGGNVWDDKTLLPVKRKIKNYYRGANEHCCYCRRDFRDEFNMVIDIEHVLPKSLFRDFMFELFNLNISCKRCNMRIKKERTDFLADLATISVMARQPSAYLMIHPNLDDYHQNIDYIVNVYNEIKSVKYIHKTPKGRFTYDFFELEKIEVEALSAAQGIDTQQTELSANIPAEIAIEVKDLLADL